MKSVLDRLMDKLLELFNDIKANFKEHEDVIGALTKRVADLEAANKQEESDGMSMIATTEDGLFEIGKFFNTLRITLEKLHKRVADLEAAGKGEDELAERVASNFKRREYFDQFVQAIRDAERQRAVVIVRERWANYDLRGLNSILEHICAAILDGAEAEKPTTSPTEAIYAFAAWLTTRDEAITASASHDAGVWAEKVAEFCESQGWTVPREHWTDLLKPYPKEKRFTQADLDAAVEKETARCRDLVQLYRAKAKDNPLVWNPLTEVMGDIDLKSVATIGGRLFTKADIDGAVSAALKADRERCEKIVLNWTDPNGVVQYPCKVREHILNGDAVPESPE